MKLDEAIAEFCTEVHTVTMSADHCDVTRYNDALNQRSPITFEVAPGITIEGDIFGVTHFDYQRTIEYKILYKVADEEQDF